MSLLTVMAGMDMTAFFGGLSFVHIKKHLGAFTRFLAPILFLMGYMLLFAIGADAVRHLPYGVAGVSALIFVLWSAKIKRA